MWQKFVEFLKRVFGYEAEAKVEPKKDVAASRQQVARHRKKLEQQAR